MPDVVVIIIIVVGGIVFGVAVFQEEGMAINVVLALIMSFMLHWYCAYLSTPTIYKETKTYRVYTVPDHGVKYVFYKNEIINLSKDFGVVVQEHYVIIKKPERLYYWMLGVTSRNERINPDMEIEGYDKP